MIKIENTEVFGWEAAIRGMQAKGYRKVNNGNYECFASVHCKYVSLGTFASENDAKETVYRYRINRFVNGVKKYNLNPNDCKVIFNKYVAFPNGMIFNLYGEKLIGMIDKSGYHEVIMNGKNYRVHRIIAELFVSNPNNKDCVNHIDGNKLNNSKENLEWCTHSENTLHSFEMGLQKSNQWGLLKRYRKEIINDCY